MSKRRFTGMLIAALAVAALSAPAFASAGWHYKFKHFIVTSKTAGSSATTFVKRCAPSIAGEWRLVSKMYVDTVSPQNPEGGEVEIDVRAKMPITTKFRRLRAVDVEWAARLPKDPALAQFLVEHYERLAQSQEDFYEGMKVRWLPAKDQLEVHHSGLYYDGFEQLAPDTYFTPFKPKPGC